MTRSTEEQLGQLAELSPSELRAMWSKLVGSPLPQISAKMLRLALAWEIQARAYGGHKREIVHLLDQLERGLTKTAPATPGMRLVREWQGRAHVVTIGDDKAVRWEGRAYHSLSEVARAITGTRWSGPAFFGLKRKAAA